MRRWRIFSISMCRGEVSKQSIIQGTCCGIRPRGLDLLPLLTQQLAKEREISTGYQVKHLHTLDTLVEGSS